MLLCVPSALDCSIPNHRYIDNAIHSFADVRLKATRARYGNFVREHAMDRVTT